MNSLAERIRRQEMTRTPCSDGQDGECPTCRARANERLVAIADALETVAKEMTIPMANAGAPQKLRMLAVELRIQPKA